MTHVSNYDETKTHNRVCKCGHKRSEHEAFPDEHCYLCPCKEFTWKRGKMDGYYLFELRAREQTIKAQAAEIERLKHSLAVEMGINTEVSKLNLGETVMRKNAEIEQWKAALDDAIELAEEGISYTGSYFTKKWRMQERLDELKSIARSALEKREVDNE